VAGARVVRVDRERDDLGIGAAPPDLLDDRGQGGLVAEIRIAVVADHGDCALRRFGGVPREIAKKGDHVNATTLSMLRRRSVTGRGKNKRFRKVGRRGDVSAARTTYGWRRCAAMTRVSG